MGGQKMEKSVWGLIEQMALNLERKKEYWDLEIHKDTQSRKEIGDKRTVEKKWAWLE